MDLKVFCQVFVVGMLCSAVFGCVETATDPAVLSENDVPQVTDIPPFTIDESLLNGVEPFVFSVVDLQTQSRQSGPGSALTSGSSLPSLPAFSTIFPVSGASCKTASGSVGVCQSQSECDDAGGVKDGNCNTILFNSAGVCCSFMVKKCSDTAVRSPMTWQTPPRMSNKYTCTLTFPANPSAAATVAGISIGGSSSVNTCQLKVEFLRFKLAGPNPETTVCEEDYMTVTGSSMPIPRLCGDYYEDQHMYIPFNGDYEDITLSFFLTESTNKDWKLKITRIPCSSPDLAPVNCLQYFTREAGQFESFNYRQEGLPLVRQLADQNYNICFKRPIGYCSVCLTPCPTVKGVPGISLTGNTTLDRSAITSGAKCPDQIIIPGGASDGGIRESVFCGNALHTRDGYESDTQICTNSDRITYITDEKEDWFTEANNAGFCLSYIQRKC